MNEVCFKNLDQKDPWSLKTYEASGGYSVWRKILNGELTPEQIIDELKTSRPTWSWWCGFPNWP